MSARVRSASRIRSRATGARPGTAGSPDSAGCAFTTSSHVGGLGWSVGGAGPAPRRTAPQGWRPSPGCGPLRTNSPTGTSRGALVDRGMQGFLVGLVGTGIGPSLTPPLHEREADELGLRYLYRLWDLDRLGLPAEGIGEVLAAARLAGYDGLNVTHPCKQLVLEHLDELSPDAAALEAVNTVVLRDGRATGHNTDTTGCAESLARGLPDARVDRVVLLGAGGAGSAVAHALIGLGCGEL